MKRITREDAGINYEVSGTGKITLLFVHGSYIDQSYWADQVEYFKNRYTVVTMDLPGHGESGKNRKSWSVKGFAEDVIAVVQELDLKNVILIGHSLGGDVNMIAATSHPSLFKGFIGIENFKAAGLALPEENQEQAQMILENVEKDFEKTNEDYVRMFLVTEKTPKTITDKIVKAYRHAYQPMGKSTMHEVFELYQTERELLPRLGLKLHLINVDYIPTNVEALKDLQQYSALTFKVKHMKGTSHYPMLENPDELNELIDDTIDEIIKESL